MSSEQHNSSKNRENRHSGFGMVSISTALVVFLCLLFEVPLFVSYSWWHGTAVIIFIITPLLIQVGLVFGAIGLFQNNRKKTLAIIGLILGVLSAVGLCLVIFLWASFGASAA